jgi:hypothetical protein
MKVVNTSQKSQKSCISCEGLISRIEIEETGCRRREESVNFVLERYDEKELGKFDDIKNNLFAVVTLMYEPELFSYAPQPLDENHIRSAELADLLAAAPLIYFMCRGEAWLVHSTTATFKKLYRMSKSLILYSPVSIPTMASSCIIPWT